MKAIKNHRFLAKMHDLQLCSPIVAPILPTLPRTFAVLQSHGSNIGFQIRTRSMIPTDQDLKN